MAFSSEWLSRDVADGVEVLSWEEDDITVSWRWSPPDLHGDDSPFLQRRHSNRSHFLVPLQGRRPSQIQAS
ncbi:hypothetical protein MHYP_G00034820 [Metynnis hypsauchen]